MNLTQRLAESEARGYERRAELSKNPKTVAKLRARADLARQRAGLAAPPPPAHAPPPTAGRPMPGRPPVNMLDAPTEQFHAVRPAPAAASSTSGPPMPLRKKIQAVTIALVIVVGGGSMLISGLTSDDEPSTPAAAETSEVSQAAGYTADDRTACREGMTSLEDAGKLGDDDRLADPGEWTGVSADMLIIAERLQGGSVQADDARVSGALGDGAQLMRRAAGTLSSLDQDEMQAVMDDTGSTFRAVGVACGPVLAGDR